MLRFLKISSVVRLAEGLSENDFKLILKKTFTFKLWKTSYMLISYSSERYFKVIVKKIQIKRMDVVQVLPRSILTNRISKTKLFKVSNAPYTAIQSGSKGQIFLSFTVVLRLTIISLHYS